MRTMATPRGHDTPGLRTAVGMSKSFLHPIEMGEHKVGLDLLDQLCRRLHGSLADGSCGMPGSWTAQGCTTRFAQFIAVCRRSKWSKHLTNSPLLALWAMAGSKAARKIISACSKAFCRRKFRRN